MSERTPVERLTELAEGWECAAKAEQGVMAAFQPWKEQFDANERSHEILRYTRVWVEARSNRDRFEKDAAAIRWALAVASERSEESSPRQVVVKVPGMNT